MFSWEYRKRPGVWYGYHFTQTLRIRNSEVFNTYFEEYLRTTAFGNYLKFDFTELSEIANSFL